MVSTKSVVLAALTAVAYAAPKPCKPTPTLPSTGSSDLPAPPAGLVLKRIALGHGIQNYTCSSPEATPSAVGALAVLYDVTDLYPGTSKTGLSSAGFYGLPSTALWSKEIPLNLVNPAATAPGVKLETQQYAATSTPFKKDTDLKIGTQKPLKFLGHHYFDANSIPVFDLFKVGLKATVSKTADVLPPASADKGPLDTGAVRWLQLEDNKTGGSKGVKQVYRVITAGGNPVSCATAGAGPGSIPYTTFYYFFG